MAEILTGTEVKPLEKIPAIRPVFSATDEAQDAFRRFSALIKGEVYPANITGFTPGGDTKVTLNGQPFILKMQQQFQVGDTLMLKFLNDEAGVGFKLVPPSTAKELQVNLSSTARELGRLVQEAGQQGRMQVYEASIPATLQPLDVKQFAADLRHAVENSGLFYESHLADYVEGARTLASLKLEPQNQSSTVAPHLLAQQLNVLETQHMQWNGEVWPGQLARWEISADEQSSRHEQQQTQNAVISSMNLELPCLGNITFKLNLLGDRLHVSIVSDAVDTADTLQKNSSALAQTLQQHVANVETVFVLNGAGHDA